MNVMVKPSRNKLPTSHPWRRAITLLLVDSLTVLASLLLAVGLRYLWDRSLLWEFYLDLWPIIFLFPIAYGLTGLYGVGIPPPEELRRLTYSSSLIFVIIGTATFMYQAGAEYSRGTFIFAWILVLFSVPLSRALAREIWARKPWWSVPVFIIGAGEAGYGIIRSLKANPSLGLRPVSVFDDDPNKHGSTAHGIPVIGSLDSAKQQADLMGVKHAVVAMPSVSRARLLDLLSVYNKIFPNLILIPDLLGISSLWVSTRDFGGVLGLEVKQRLLLRGPRLVKRFMDVILVVLTAPLILLIGALMALWIRLDSPGPAVFTQIRPGLGGIRFKIYKFRSMYLDAEARMKLLPEHLQDEFKQYGKIQNDPRVTRAGYWLRKFSVDEFPQFWNVLRGDISLVGPRAYLIEQLEQMKGYEESVLSVLPGLTGLWQVSGRSEVTLIERLNLDSYYVRNWSPWLDIYILARTIWVVFAGKGAY